MKRRGSLPSNYVPQQRIILDAPPKQAVLEWRQLMCMPSNGNTPPSAVAIWFQGKEFTKHDYEMLCKYVELMGRLYDNDRHSDNTDDCEGWWKEMFRRDA